MKRFGFFTALIVGALAIVNFSCTYEELITPKVEVPDSVSFAANIIPIFNSSCNVSGCHSKGGIPPNLAPADAYTSLIFFGYVDVDVPEASELYVEIATGSMQQYATDQERALILSWIEQGALDN